MATQNSAVSHEPPIYSGTGVRASQVSAGDGNNGNRGNVLVHGFWKRGEDAVLDTQVVDCDASSRRNYMDSETILESCVRVKKLQYLQSCAERRHSFMPLIYSVDGMAGREAQSFEKRITHILTEKWERHYMLDVVELANYSRPLLGCLPSLGYANPINQDVDEIMSSSTLLCIA